MADEGIVSHESFVRHFTSYKKSPLEIPPSGDPSPYSSERIKVRLRV